MPRIALAMILFTYSTSLWGQTLVRYDGNDFPENNDPPFGVVVGCDVRSINGGVLNIVDNLDGPPATSTCSLYTRADTLDGTSLAVMDFRLRVNSSSSSLPPDNRAVAAGFLDGARVVQLGFSTTDLAVMDSNGANVPDTTVSLDTTEFHDYTIVKYRDVATHVYVDGDLVLDIPYTDLDAHAGSPRQAFGNNSGPGLADTDWDSVDYSIELPDALPRSDFAWAGRVTNSINPPVLPENALGPPDGPHAGFFNPDSEATYDQFGIEATTYRDAELAELLGVDVGTLLQADFIVFEANGNVMTPCDLLDQPFEGGTWTFRSNGGAETETIVHPGDGRIIAEGAIDECSYRDFFASEERSDIEYAYLLIDLSSVDANAPDFGVTILRGPTAAETPDPDAMGVLCNGCALLFEDGFESGSTAAWSATS